MLDMEIPVQTWEDGEESSQGRVNRFVSTYPLHLQGAGTLKGRQDVHLMMLTVWKAGSHKSPLTSCDNHDILSEIVSDYQRY